MLLKLMEELAKESEAVDGGGDDQGSEGAEAIKVAMAGAAFLCSVPPSGNGPMTKRFIKEVRFAIWRSWRCNTMHDMCVVCRGSVFATVVLPSGLQLQRNCTETVIQV